MFYGMPIHIIRDVALTIRSFHKRITDFIRYRQATRDMNARYPDATLEEVSREDCCIICRENMTAWSQQPRTSAQPQGNTVQDTQRPMLDERLRPKKLPCGHVLHFACLRSWLERQQNCPTCRAPVLPSTATRLQQHAQDQAPREPPQINVPQNPIPGQRTDQRPRVQAQNVFQFGPFRVAFGARRGFQDLPQLPNQQPPSTAAGAGNIQPIRNPFESNVWAPGTHSRTAANLSPITPSTQLQHIEQQLIAEINSLRIQADQLYAVRALQNELAQLRQQQAFPGGGSAAPSTQIHQHRRPISSPRPDYTPQNGAAFASHSASPVLDFGHNHLPVGMTIPEGWTVLPLQRLSETPETNQVNAVSAHSAPDGNMIINDADLIDYVPPTTPELSTPAGLSSVSRSPTTQTSERSRGVGTSNLSSDLRQNKSSQLAFSVPGSSSDGGSKTTVQQMAKEPVIGRDDLIQTAQDDHGKGKGRAATVEESTDAGN